MSSKKKRERNICSVTNCRQYREAHKWPEPLSFHEFPADVPRRKLWLQGIGRENWNPGDKAKVCSMHFELDCYRETVMSKKLLKNTAIPTLNLVLEVLSKEEAAKEVLPTIVDVNEEDPLAVITPDESVSKPQTFYICSVTNCRQYREANKWSEPLSFHELPSDPVRKQLWQDAVKNVNWIPKEKAKVCSVHFEADDYRDSAKKTLKPTAIPTLNLELIELSISPDSSKELEPRIVLTAVSCAQAKKKAARRELEIAESRKRISNIIVVDLVKDKKKMKYPDSRKELSELHPANVEDSCSACLEMKKDLREVQFQLAQVRKELEQQKTLVEFWKRQAKDK